MWKRRDEGRRPIHRTEPQPPRGAQGSQVILGPPSHDLKYMLQITGTLATTEAVAAVTENPPEGEATARVRVETIPVILLPKIQGADLQDSHLVLETDLIAEPPLNPAEITHEKAETLPEHEIRAILDKTESPRRGDLQKSRLEDQIPDLDLRSGSLQIQCPKSHQNLKMI